MTPYTQKRTWLRLHGEGLETTPHNFGDSGRYKNLYAEWKGDKNAKHISPSSPFQLSKMKSYEKLGYDYKGIDN